MQHSARPQNNQNWRLPAIPGLAFPLLVLWVAISPFFQVHQGIPVPGGLPSLTFDRGLLLVITILLLTHAWVQRRPLRIGPVEIGFFFYLVIQAILLPMTASDPKLALIDFLNILLLPFIAYFATRNLVTTERRFAVVVVALVLSSIPLALTGIYEHFTGQSLFTSELLWTDVGLGRAAGPLINPAVYGLALAILVALAFFTLAQTTTGWVRFASGVAIGLSTAALFWTYTRSAWASAGAALLLLFLTDSRTRRVTIPIAIVAVLVLALNWQNFESTEIYQTRIADPENATGRVDSFDLQLVVFGQSPWLGLGRGVYNIQWRPSNDWVSHNTAMTMLLDGGVVELVPYLGFIVVILLGSTTAYRRLPGRGFRSRPMMGALWASALAYGVTAMLIDTTYFVYPTAFLWFTLGLIAALTDTTAAEQPERPRLRRIPIAYQARERWRQAEPASMGAVGISAEPANTTAPAGGH